MERKELEMAIERTEEVLGSREDSRARRVNATAFHLDRDIRLLVQAATGLARLRADAARLDWIEKNAGALGFCDPGDDQEHWIVSNDLANEDPISHGATLREAIDAAISAEKQP